MKIGLISDTHNYVDPALWDIFSDVDCILHAGDITCEDILFELSTIAPVYAVHGNSDGFPLASKLPSYRLIQKSDILIYVTHILGNKKDFIFRLRRDGIKSNPDVVVFGHTHKAGAEKFDGILFINPGCAGKQRSKGLRSVAILELKGTTRNILYKFYEL